MACSTRALVAGRMLGEPLITRETVWWLTPASRATSAITGFGAIGLHGMAAHPGFLTSSR